MYLRRWISKLAVASGAIGFAAFGMAPSSEGAITLTMQLGPTVGTVAGVNGPSPGGTNTNPSGPSSVGTTASLATGNYSNSSGSVQVNVLAATEKLNGSTGAQSEATSLTLTNTTGSTIVVTIAVHADAFNQPTGPVTITDSFAASNLSVGSVATFNATVQGNPTLATQTLNGAGASAISAPDVIVGGSVSTPYSIDQLITLTLLADGIATLTATTTLASAVPEPSTMALAIAGVPALGMFWLRRRRASS